MFLARGIGRRSLEAGQKSVIPLENGLQDLGMRMDPGLHRGGDKAGMTEQTSTSSRQIHNPSAGHGWAIDDGRGRSADPASYKISVVTALDR